MKHFLSLMLSALILTGIGAIPVSAEEASDDAVTLLPIYPFDAPTAGNVEISIEEGTIFDRIEVEQISQENDHLLMFEYDGGDASQVNFSLEPGAYQMKIYAFSLEDQVRNTIASVYMNIENPDFSSTITQTDFKVKLSQADATVGEYSTHEKKVYDKETGIETHNCEICIFRYEGIFGDLDNDNAVTADDASNVLGHYLKRVLDPLYDPPSDAIIHGDYDSNGYITADDANAVLSYYLGTMLSPDYTWDDVKAK